MTNSYTKIIGISGPSCSGKSLLAKNLHKAFSDKKTERLSIDSYYKDLSDLPLTNRAERNYDSPEAFDLELLVKNISDVKINRSAVAPVYDFKTHTRSDETILIKSPDILIVDGILTLAIDKLRELLDFSIYIEIDHETALERRIQRDHKKRGRTKESVIKQYNDTVFPMCEKYIKPSIKFAELILDGAMPPSELLNKARSRLETIF